MQYIKSINLITTYKCNLKCNHCDIWSNPNKNDLNIDPILDFLRLDSVQGGYQYYREKFDISISGGEPLLVSNIADLIHAIHTILPGSVHSLSTNGTLSKKLIELLVFMRQNSIPYFRKINFSVDGNEKNHDAQRGVRGSFQKTIKTILLIKKLFPEIYLELKLTITKQNYRDILYLSKLADSLGVFFSFKPVENMYHYTNQSSENQCTFSPDEIDSIEKQIIENPYLSKQNYYIPRDFFDQIPEYLRFGLGEKKKLCTIAQDSITILPDGTVYSCILMDSIGSVYGPENPWNSLARNKQQEDICAGKCPECMLMCGYFKSHIATHV